MALRHRIIVLLLQRIQPCLKRRQLYAFFGDIYRNWRFLGSVFGLSASIVPDYFVVASAGYGNRNALTVKGKSPRNSRLRFGYLFLKTGPLHSKIVICAAYAHFLRRTAGSKSYKRCNQQGG